MINHEHMGAAKLTAVSFSTSVMANIGPAMDDADLFEGFRLAKRKLNL